MDSDKSGVQLRLVALLPTFNERENIGPIVQEVLSLDQHFGVLVVDDDSPDGTAQEVEALAGRYPGRVFVRVRKERRGRGLAGIEGFVEALKIGPEFVVEMDADFSHQPRFIPEFVAAIGDFDVVIGSRFVPGGGEVGRSIVRRVVTRFANFYIRLVLGIPVRDLTSGFRLFRAAALRRLPLAGMISRGPEVVQEVLCLAKRYGLRLKEHPIVFYDRKAGRSSFGWRIALRSLMMMWRFRFRYLSRSCESYRH